MSKYFMFWMLRLAAYVKIREQSLCLILASPVEINLIASDGAFAWRLWRPYDTSYFSPHLDGRVSYAD